MLIGTFAVLLALGLVFLASGLFLNTSAQVGPNDASMLAEDAITKSATYTGTAFDMGAGYAPGGVGQPVAAKIDISSIETDSGNETYTFTLKECATSDGSFTAIGPALALTASGSTAVTGVFAVPGFASKRYLKLDCTIGGTIATGLTYSAWIVPLGRPG